MSPKDLALELLRCVNRRDAEGALALFAPHAELCFPAPAPRRVFRGGDELRQFFDWLTQALPLQTIAADRIHVGPRSVTVEFETAGTSRRGHGFDNVGALVVDTDGSKIVSVRVYLDTADLARILEVA